MQVNAVLHRGGAMDQSQVSQSRFSEAEFVASVDQIEEALRDLEANFETPAPPPRRLWNGQSVAAGALAIAGAMAVGGHLSPLY
ncbi:MAG: hypothetical protein JWQ36_3111 [Enterovirga sp.]|jgi:hypothetical protein|nr:hypothetical protein [Enterovirga sp.]